MSTPRALVCLCVPICLGLLALCPLAQAQTTPTVYTISEALVGDPGTLTMYRNGDKILMESVRADQSATSLYDLKTGVSLTWDPKASPIQCSAGRFSGDWGDPFAMTAEVTADIAKGDMKPMGTETIGGILTQVYGESLPQGNVKVWLDKKDNLVMRATTAGPGVDTVPTALVDIRKLSFATPDSRLFMLPAACAGVHPAPTPAEVIADETGDSADNYVNAIYGPGSANSCSILVRVVTAKTMTPITNRLQFAIDTTYDQNNPPHYEFGMGTDGSQSYAGGGVHEITNQAHNGMVKIDNPPAYFNLSVNLMKPNYGAGMGLIYRQCFQPTTVLLYVVNDPNDPQAGADWLYAKGGKFAVVP